jgi:hypothetical protein
MADEKAEPFRMFYYPQVTDSATKFGYTAADVFVVLFSLAFLWALFGHH